MKRSIFPVDDFSAATKDKVMSIRIYPETFEKFSRINRAQGLSNNSAMNMIISKYVRENEYLLAASDQVEQK